MGAAIKVIYNKSSGVHLLLFLCADTTICAIIVTVLSVHSVSYTHLKICNILIQVYESILVSISIFNIQYVVNNNKEAM